MTYIQIWFRLLVLSAASLVASPAAALTSQTITGFSPTTPTTYSTGKTIALSATGGGSGNPVVFTSATTSVCSVSGNTATVLKVGTCTLTANQAGNATYGAASQVTRGVVINKGSQTITFATLPAKPLGSLPFAVSATASSGLTVTFSSSTTTICTVSVATVTLIKSGTCTIVASQSGNTNFNAATQVTRSFSVSAVTSVGLAAPANNASYLTPASIALSATTTAKAGASIVKVEFFAAYGTDDPELVGTDTSSPYSLTWSDVYSGTYTLTAKVTDSTAGVATSSPVTVTVTPRPPPVVNITSPANNAVFSAPANIPVTVTASASAPLVIGWLEYFLDGNYLTSLDPATPFTFSDVGAGTHLLTVTAFDIDGQSGTSPPVTVTVNSAVQRPTVSLTSPGPGTLMSAPATIGVTATATPTAPGSSITKVDFFHDSTLLFSDTDAPYAHSISGVPVGRYGVKAIATDSDGVTGESAVAYVMVEGEDSCSGAPPIAAADAATRLATLDKLPTTFEVNAGQQDDSVRFTARGAGFQLFLTSGERVLAMQAPPVKNQVNTRGETGSGKNISRSAAVRMRYVGANPAPEVVGINQLEQQSHYLAGSNPANWQTGVRHFARAAYRDLYPGIDEVYYGQDGSLEFDLNVAPGASPEAIRLAVSGIDRMSLDERGDLLLETPLGTLVQRKPVAYQDIDGARRAVDANYRIVSSGSENEVAFDLGEYDPTRALVIDPVLVYSTLLGAATNYSTANGLALSRCGEAFLVGSTYAPNFPTTAGTLDPAGIASGTGAAARNMGFISKFNASGTGLLYSTYITAGPGSHTEVLAVAVDATGHAYFTGSTDSAAFPTTPGSAFPAAAAGAFVAKVNNIGSGLVYGSYLPGSIAVGIAIDGAGAAYVAGDRNVWKVNPAGTALDYAAVVGGSGNPAFGQFDAAQAIAVDAGGNAYVAGVTASADLPVTAGAFQTTLPRTSASGYAGFVSKINPAGSGLVYSTYLGTTSNTEIFALALDAAGNAYVTGRTKDSITVPNFSGPFNSFIQDTQLSTNLYALAAKLNATGSQLAYFSRIGGSFCQNFSCGTAQTWANAIAVDGSGHAWISGQTDSNQIPLVKPLISQFAGLNNGPNLFAAKLNAAGDSLRFSTLLGGATPLSYPPNGDPTPNIAAIAVDAIGSAYIAGTTDKADFPTTVGAFQAAPAAGAGASPFVVKINETKDTTTTLTVTPNPAEVGNPVTLTATLARVYAGTTPSGNVNFHDGANLLGSATISGATAQLITSQLSGGTHSLSASYTGDARNHTSDSETVALTLSNANGLPTVTLTGNNGLGDGTALVANAGATYTGANVTVTANAAPGNTLNEVRIHRQENGYNIWAPLSASFTTGLTFPALPTGFHAIHATTTDNFNHNAISAPIRFVVNPAAATAPTVAITAPAGGSSHDASSAVVFSANTVPAGGATISYVYFFSGGTQIGVATASPFTTSWTNAPVGSHSIIALAVDSAGARALSAPVVITVRAPAGVPGAPTLASATPGAGSATLLFAAPASPGGSVITGYTGTCSAAGQPTVTAAASAGATSLIVTGLVGSIAYSCTVAATNSLGTGAASNSMSVTPTAVATVTITAPANNARFGTTSPIDISVTAQVAPNNIAKLEIFDGTSLLTTFTPGTLSALTATYSWSGMATGSHSLSAKVTDSLGNATTSATVTVQVSAAPTVSFSTLSNYHLTGSTIDLNASAAAADGATIAKVEFFAGSSLIGTVSTPPYSLRWPNAVSGSYVLTAKATDSQNLATTSAPVAITVGSSVSNQFVSGLDGSTVDEDDPFVSGTVSAPPNSSVMINGQLATMSADGRFFVNGLYLQPGSNAVTATITAPDGQTSSQTITINRSNAPALFSVSVTPSGIATATSPFTADIGISNPNATAFATVTVACSDPGPGSTYSAMGTYQCSYTEPGIVTVRVTVKNAAGGTTYSVTKQVHIQAAAAHIAVVKAVYYNMIDRLKAGDKAGALNMFFGHSRAMYDAIFTSLGTNLALFAAQGGALAAVTATGTGAELTVVRIVGAEKHTFFIYLLLGEDGIWRIESM